MFSIARLVISLLLVLLGLASVLFAKSNPTSKKPPAYKASAKDVAQLAKCLKFIDEGHTVDANNKFNYNRTAAAFGVPFAKKVQAEYQRQQKLYPIVDSSKIPVGHSPGGSPKFSQATGKKYAVCLLKRVGFGVLVDNLAIIDSLAKKQYTKAAILILEAAALLGIIAVLGVPGLAAKLLVFSVYCRLCGPWYLPC